MADPQHEPPTPTTHVGGTSEMNGSKTAPTTESSDHVKSEEKDGAAPHAHTNGSGAAHTTSNDLQAAMAELVPREIAQYAPLLVGKYYVQDKRAVWAGRWGMSEAAFAPNGVTSAFEMKSDEDVYIRTSSGDVTTVHPVFASGPLAKSSRLENDSAENVTPVYHGYESDPAVRSALPFDCKYSGFFQIQAVKGKPQTVTEKSVDIRFVHDARRPSQFYVSGTGENKFGLFNLVGLLDKETSELRLYKLYKPKEKEKRAQPKRTRTATRPPTTPAAAVPKAQPKAVAAPVPAAAVAPPTITAPPIQSVAVPALSFARPSISTPMGSEGSAASPYVAGRGRSERKRVMPAHLRDENVIDHDQASPLLKKCHAILKGLMANPKAGPFLAPVDPVALGIPNYFDVIKEPMDLGTIRHNLEAGYYDDVDVFVDHVRLVFDNAMLYNAAHSQVHIFAAKLAEDFEKRIKNLNAKHSKEKFFERSNSFQSTASSSIIKLKRERKGEPTHSTKKIKGGRGAKGNTKRASSDGNEGLIMSLKEDIERLKATLEQLQPVVRVVTPKTSKAASRPFKMEDLTEEELNEPMTQSEKARLSDDIRQLPQDKINRVLQIIAESVPMSKLTNENDEVEIDINSFDTRCLRMLEGYVRESGIGRKRKRPTAKKTAKSAPVLHRLNSAKSAAANIRQRQQQLKNQLAMIEGDSGVIAGAVPAIPSSVIDVDMEKPSGHDGSSSDSSSSSSDSSDSDSESESESDSDNAAPLQRSPMLTSGATLSQLSDSARADATKKIRDEATSKEPLRVENRGAWSLLAQKDAKNAESMLPADENPTSSLWMSARSMEQVKQQKIQQKEKERTEEREEQRRRETEQRVKDRERERDELARRKHAQDSAARKEREERAQEAERARAAQRAVEREKLMQDEGMDDQHEHTLTEDLESFSSSSFL